MFKIIVQIDVPDRQRRIYRRVLRLRQHRDV